MITANPEMGICSGTILGLVGYGFRVASPTAQPQTTAPATQARAGAVLFVRWPAGRFTWPRQPIANRSTPLVTGIYTCNCFSMVVPGAPKSIAGEQLTKAIEGIVDAYVMLGDRQALEDLRMHRRKLALDLKGRRGSYDFSLPLGQIDEEIAIIEAGLERLNNSTNL